MKLRSKRSMWHNSTVVACMLAVLPLAGCGGKPEIKPSAPKSEPARQGMPDLSQTPSSPSAPTLPVLASAPAQSAPELPAITQGLSTQQMADVENLSFLLRDYLNVNMQMPKDLNDLVKSGLIKSIPAPPPGKAFMIDRKNNRVVVVNTSTASTPPATQ